MSKEINKIYRTKDLSMFKIHDENRDIIPAKVRSLAADMRENGWQLGSVVTVDVKMRVINGQHRVLGARQANVPVDYMILKGATGDTIRRQHMNLTPWKIMDNLGYYVKQGNQNYILLSRFMKNFPKIKPTDCGMLVKNSGTSYARRREFEDGKFEVKDMKLAYEWGHNIMSIKPYFEYYNQSLFVRAMIISLKHPEFVFGEFLHRAQIRRSMLYKCGSVPQYLEMIEKLYNFRRPKDQRIRLRPL